MKEISRLLLRIKLVRYLVSGGTAALINFLLLFALTEFLEVWYLASAVIAFIVSFCASFTLQKFWTFRDGRLSAAPRQMVQHLSLAVGMIALDTVFLYLAVEILGLWYMLAQFIIFGALAVGSFFIYSRYIFKKPPQADDRGKKTIVIATGVYPPEIGGPATYVRLLEEGLPRDKFLLRVVPFRSVRGYPKILRHLMYALLLCAEAEGSDAIFAQDPVSVGAPALMAAWGSRKQFILKIVGDYAWEQFQTQNAKRKAQNNAAKHTTVEQFQNGKYDFVTEARRAVQKFVVRRAEKVIVPSEYLAGIVRGWGVASERITVIYNAFTPVALEKSKEELRLALGLQGKVIATAGRLVPWKGFDTAICALNDIVKDIPDASLVIMGSGPDFSKLQSIAYATGLGGKVRFTQMLPHEEMLAYIKASDLFMLPTYYEGFSHLLLEVMAVGTPIITTPMGGNLELITPRREGVLVAPQYPAGFSSEAKRLLLDPNESHALVQNAKARVAQFSVERMIRETTGALA